ncbi:MAG: hypothetical protein QG594_2463, partial [Bacteroidota bacterium]|nr:hypothetical protein [Bacteroidota bacterium]
TNLKTPDITMDEIRIANTWQQVVGKAGPMAKADVLKLVKRNK